MDHSEKITSLVLEVFRLNGALIESGNALVKDLGLTSARWQVLGALSLSQDSMTVPDIAQAMGLTRQSVQRLANEMADEGILEFKHNPQHKRSKIVALLPKGHDLYACAMAKQTPWAEALGKGITLQELNIAMRVFKTMRNNVIPESTKL